MKVKYLLTGMLVAAMSLVGCASVDELNQSEANIMDLVVKGTLMQNRSVDYDSVIDEATNTITVQVPYYVSDTDPIMSDLSQVRLHASLPNGAKFVPSLAGIVDLSEGKTVQSTLVYANGTEVTYEIGATRVKSNACALTDVVFNSEDVRVASGLSHPEGGSNGKITVMNTSALVLDALGSVTFKGSPWATIEINGQTSTGNELTTAITNGTIIKVRAQDGTTLGTYEVVVQEPALVKPGMVGYVSAMFGFQFHQGDERGWVGDAHTTMAAVGSYLIVSNAKDFTKMVVLNRYTAKLAKGVSVNTTGIDSKYCIRAITTDDAGHLVAMTYVSTREKTSSSVANGHGCFLTDPTVCIWVWKDGIDKAPRSVFNGNIAGGAFNSMATKPQEIGNTICVKGDMTSGKAVAVTVDKFAAREYAFYFNDGNWDGAAKMECPTNAAGTLQWGACWNASKAVPLTTDSPLSYYLSSANQNQTTLLQLPAKDLITLAVPTNGYWWKGSGSYDKAICGIDFVDFNGMTLMAVANGQVSSNIWSFRLYVSNLCPIGGTPTATSLNDGFIFDSRVDGSGKNIAGTGYAPTGCTSTYTFDNSKKMVEVDPNETGNASPKFGDVIFAKSSENSVQVYMLSYNAGIFAYEITAYDM